MVKHRLARLNEQFLIELEIQNLLDILAIRFGHLFCLSPSCDVHRSLMEDLPISLEGFFGPDLTATSPFQPEHLTPERFPDIASPRRPRGEQQRETAREAPQTPA